MVQYIRGRYFGNYLKIHGPLLLKSSRVAIVFFWGGGWLGIARQPFVDVSYCHPRHRTSPHVTLAFRRRAVLSYERLCFGLVIRVDLLSTFHTFARVVGLALLLFAPRAGLLPAHQVIMPTPQSITPCIVRLNSSIFYV